MPAPTTIKAYEISPRDYKLLIPSWMAITNNYERDEDNDDKYEKVEEGDILVEEAG